MLYIGNEKGGGGKTAKRPGKYPHTDMSRFSMKGTPLTGWRSTYGCLFPRNFNDHVFLLKKHAPPPREKRVLSCRRHHGWNPNGLTTHQAKYRYPVDK